MSWGEWVYWCAVHNIDPLGEERMDLRFGNIAATFLNWAGGKRGRRFTAEQFSFVKKPEKKFDGKKFIKGMLDFVARQKAPKQADSDGSR